MEVIHGDVENRIVGKGIADGTGHAFQLVREMDFGHRCLLSKIWQPGRLIQMCITEMPDRNGSIEKWNKDAAAIRITRYIYKEKQGRPSELF